MVPSHSSGEARRPGPATSRRSVLKLAGATAGTGLLTGQATGETDPVGEPATVAVSPSQRTAVVGALDRLEAPVASALSVERMETTSGFRAFADGEVDLLVGSRPILAGERSRLLENDVGYESREIPTSIATLDPPAASWSDCLRPATLAAAWSSDDAVETWAEVSSAEGTSSDETTALSPGDRDVPSSHVEAETALVRGIRSHQYAIGAGGVGYYEPEPGWIDVGAETGGERSTTLVRLSYLYGDRSVLDRSGVAAFIDAFAQDSAERVGNLAYYADPLGQ